MNFSSVHSIPREGAKVSEHAHFSHADPLGGLIGPDPVWIRSAPRIRAYKS